jgi:hypothetical protein
MDYIRVRNVGQKGTNRHGASEATFVRPLHWRMPKIFGRWATRPFDAPMPTEIGFPPRNQVESLYSTSEA